MALGLAVASHVTRVVRRVVTVIARVWRCSRVHSKVLVELPLLSERSHTDGTAERLLARVGASVGSQVALT